MSCFGKICVLAWVVQKHWFIAALDILFPVFIVLLGCIIKTNIDRSSPNVRTGSDIKKGPTYHKLHTGFDLFQDLHPTPTVKYTPENEFTKLLMGNVAKLLNMRQLPVSVKSAEDLGNNEVGSLLFEVGVIFRSAAKDSRNLSYVIRTASAQWDATDRTFYVLPPSGPPIQDSENTYYTTGFLAVQKAIDWSFLTSVIPPDKLQHINHYVQEIPFPPYTEIWRSETPPALIPLMIVIGYSVMIMSTVGKIVEDKQTGATELLKMMGMSKALLWLGWFVQLLLIVFIVTIFFALSIKFVSLKGPASAPRSDILVIWLFLFVGSIACFVSWFFVSAILQRAWLAMLLGTLGWIVTFQAAWAMDNNSMDLIWKLLTCLIPSLALFWGFSVIALYEDAKVGLLWKNMNYSPFRAPDDIAMTHVFLMLLFDIFFYAFLTWYIGEVRPGQFGVPKPFYFPFTISYWWTSKGESRQPTESEDEALQENFERPPPDLIPGVKILNLRKVFKKKPAVDGVTIDIYQDQITVLLGHNGAGKTTTMSIMTGLIPATSGSVWINGHNIRTHMSKARESLGLCPQHDMLFNDMTVKKHLMLFGMLKGLTYNQASFAALEMLKKVNLSNAADAKARTLSGGMKRKLALGIALVGGSKVVILDEPTSGLDPEARRQVWDMLLALRGECTILITTHFMEEADVLGDRIAIMDHGKVQCYGTPIYLKNKYGTGYMLKLLTLPGHDPDTITKYVQSRVAGATFKRQIGSELDYVLPQDNKSQFPGLFSGLDGSKQTLYIDSIGLSISTMEDVFIQVREQSAAARGTGDDRSTVDVRALLDDARARSKGAWLCAQQTRALMIKKVLHTYRNWIATLVFMFVPVLLMVGVMFASLALVDNKSYDVQGEAVLLTLDKYKSTTVIHTSVENDIVVKYNKAIKKYGAKRRLLPSDAGMSETLLLLGVADLATYDKLAVVAEFNETDQSLDVTAMYSSSAVHAAPISINLVNNAILKTYAGEEYSITVASYPIILAPSTMTTFNGMSPLAYIWMFLLPLGLLLFVASFVLFPYEERVSGSKHLQRMTGVGPAHYWLTCFLWDFLIYLVVAVLCVVVMVTVDSKHVFGQGREAGVLLLLLLMYGMNVIPWAYVFSYWRKSAVASLNFFLMINIAICFALIQVIAVIGFASMSHGPSAGPPDEPPKPPDSGSGAVTSAVKVIASLHPPLNIWYSLEILVPAMMENRGGGGKSLVSFTPGGLGWHLLMYVVSTLLLVFKILRADYRCCKKANTASWQQNPDDMQDDVKEEVDRVFAGGEYELAAYDLKKNYGRNLAVKGVTFGVEAGGCFGLLGFNGAGKTSVFKMLTGLELPTQGDAVIHKYSLSKNTAKFTSQIGYCPQFDAINEYMTGKEMLLFYSRLRGVHRRDVKPTVDMWIKLMGLEEYKNIQCGKYSGGNKRKLSTAMALIGNPPLVFLDEPTSGVDPVARRNLWTVLRLVQESGDRAIVLTTHSMEECEALASRLAIMVLGEFVCIGENQYLKNKFCQGFGVNIKMTDPPIEEDQAETVKSAFVKMFNADQCILKDERRGVLHYHLTDTKVSWNTLFSNMESLKASQKSVEVYTVTETTLEQVFLSFATNN